MEIAILGTGTVGRTLARALSGLGHQVQVGTRDVTVTQAREPAAYEGLSLLAYSDAAAGAELVINATAGTASMAALQAAGEQNLAGRTLLDVSNALDFSGGFPPSLFVKDTDSLGEQIQRAFPEAHVVKTLNTMNAEVMVNPGLLATPTAVFLSGDHAGAKQQARTLLEGFGWEHIIDLGGITTARGVEMMLPMWLNLMSALGSATFNWAVVEGGEHG
ncbi:MAG: NAD(P)-binding domain-containing protein [Candidatus Nanopelagicales bacterium]|nr:NAD(P)-binding domain-containing protein [Candidatus Nanopelagicales bacterium]